MATATAGHGVMRSNREVPRICGWCGSDLCLSIVCPTYWPIDSVGLGCSYCGAIIDYRDELRVFTAREALKQYQDRVNFKFKRRKGYSVPLPPAKTASSYEHMKHLILMGIEGGMRAQEVADLMGIHTMEVIRVIRTEEEK